jgi:hypothetical protein
MNINNKGNIRFTYTWARAETDAVPSVFSYSDFGRNGGTNVTGHFNPDSVIEISRRILDG